MSDLTRVLSQITSGDATTTDQLLPLVYDELKRMAAAKMARERPGLTLDATALVHEAYLRLVGVDAAPSWQSRSHFFGAAAEAMRRILVEQARRKRRRKHGGALRRVELPDAVAAPDDPSCQLLEVDAALTRLTEDDPLAAEVVKLHYFAGLSLAEAAALLGISRATAYRHWTYARAWLRAAIER